MGFSLGGSAEKGQSSSSGSESSVISGTKTTKKNLDKDAIEYMLNEALGGNQGLSAIFKGEQNAGVYNSSVAAEASGDLVTKIIGELAALTAEEVVTTDGTTDTVFSERGKSSKAGAKFGFEF